MDELKTLKDLEKDLLIFYGACSHCNQIDYSKIKSKEHPLKQSAINDIKEIMITKPFVEYELVDVIDPKSKPLMKAVLTSEGETLIEWIKWKFNLTKRDLK